MPSNDLTLAISLQALEELTRPKRALEDAATWTCHVGIISSEPSFIERRRVREAGYPQDFLSGPRSLEEALTHVRRNFETERYVFVGTSESHERIAHETNWAYQPVAKAATAAGWQQTASVSRDNDWLGRENEDSR